MSLQVHVAFRWSRGVQLSVSVPHQAVPEPGLVDFPQDRGLVFLETAG